MIIKSVSFEKSSSKLSECPAGRRPEFAIIGRSNVGKSSLINMITDRKGLAKISVSPGKTKLINHFLINDSWYLVDLPGYGYARVSKKEKEGFVQIIRDYILKREQLFCIFVLLDIRIEPQANDLNFINWLGSSEVPFVLVFTKTDKIKQADVATNRGKYENELSATWNSLPEIFMSSAVKKKGRDEILAFIENLIRQARQ